MELPWEDFRRKSSNIRIEGRDNAAVVDGYLCYKKNNLGREAGLLKMVGPPLIFRLPKRRNVERYCRREDKSIKYRPSQ